MLANASSTPAGRRKTYSQQRKKNQQFLALNIKQLEDTLTNMFLGSALTLFQDARLCADKGYSGINNISGLMEAYSNWGKQRGRLQEMVILQPGFEVDD